MRIRKDDQVMVISGKDRGKKGRVMRVFPGDNALLVEKINYHKKTLRRSQTNPKGGIALMEGKLHASKVMLVCPRCSKPTRVGMTVLADGTRQRSCKACHEILGV